METFSQVMLIAAAFWAGITVWLDRKTELIGEIIRPNYVVAVLCIGSAIALGQILALGLPIATLIEKGMAYGLGSALGVSTTRAIAPKDAAQAKGDHGAGG